MSKSIVWRLLRRNISIGQLAGYAVANLVGLAIVLTAVQFYRDVTSARDEDDSFISRDYIIVSKKSVPELDRYLAEHVNPKDFQPTR